MYITLTKYQLLVRIKLKKNILGGIFMINYIMFDGNPLFYKFGSGRHFTIPPTFTHIEGL